MSGPTRRPRPGSAAAGAALGGPVGRGGSGPAAAAA